MPAEIKRADYQLMELLAALKVNKAKLTRQQLKTIKGQALAGDIKGARAGLWRLIGHE